MYSENIRLQESLPLPELQTVISFFSYNPQSMGKTVTHKIREIKYLADGSISGFVTYGINTGVNDIVEVKPEHVIGKYDGKIPEVGRLFSFLKTPRGFYLSILIPGVLLIIFFSITIGKVIGRNALAKEYEKDKNDLESRLQQLENTNNQQGRSLMMDENLQQGLEQNDNVDSSQQSNQTTSQSSENSVAQNQGQNPTAIYQTVNITYPQMPFAQPVIYQTAPGQPNMPIYQSISMMPTPVAYQPMPNVVMPAPANYQQMPAQQPVQVAPVVYQMPVQQPVQQTPVIFQTVGENGAPVVYQQQSGVAPTICQTVGENPPVISQPVAPIQPTEQIVATENQQVIETPNTQDTIIEEQKEEETSITLDAEDDGEEENQESGQPLQNRLNIPKGEKLTFADKILEAKEDTQKYFNKIHNELISYKKVNARVSLRCISYRKGRTLIAKIGIRGKTLTGYFNLDVKDFNQKIYFQKDMSGKRAYAEVPFAVKIKSERACNNATNLVSAIAEKFELQKDPKFQEVDQVEQLKKENK